MLNPISAILLFLFTLVMLFLVNYKYKKTVFYKNKQIFFEDYLNGVPYDLKIVNFGSTYAKFAFENYSEMQLKGFNFALPSQSLDYDRIILENYSEHLAKGCVVIISVAAFLMLCGKNYATSTKYYAVLKRKQIPDFRWKGYIKFKYPALVAKKQLLRVVKDVKMKDSIYSQFPVKVTELQIDAYMNELVHVWKRIFGLHDFKETKFSDKNINDMEHTTRELKKIIDFCISKGFQPVIVVPPFSENMNQYFSDEFAKVCTTDSVAKTNAGSVPFLDYRKNEFFQKRTELYVDGGFRLNKTGSRLFMNMLFEDMKAVGITINNATVGMYSKER